MRLRPRGGRQQGAGTAPAVGCCLVSSLRAQSPSPVGPREAGAQGWAWAETPHGLPGGGRDCRENMDWKGWGWTIPDGDQSSGLGVPMANDSPFPHFPL